MLPAFEEDFYARLSRTVSSAASISAISFATVSISTSSYWSVIIFVIVITVITVIVVFYGAALKTALLAMCRQTDALAVLPVMTFCAVFFALLNRYLRRRFAVR